MPEATTIAIEDSGIDGLVGAAQAGDREAFGELYRRFVRMVHGILLARLPRVDVDDAAQDVFVDALKQIGKLRDRAAFGGWVAQIARRHAIDHFRRARHTEPLISEVTASASEDREAWMVLDAVVALPEAYRETMILRFVEGMTGPEIAEQTGLAPGSVRVNLHRGVQMLREKLAKGGTRA
jgi:RNA polymerase sigma-70 factor (ECF subfamily)